MIFLEIRVHSKFFFFGNNLLSHLLNKGDLKKFIRAINYLFY